MTKLPITPTDPETVDRDALAFNGLHHNINRSYPTGEVYDQMAFDGFMGSYELDPNFCVGCAVANAAQGMLRSAGIDATGNYGQRLYEVAMRRHYGDDHGDAKGGLKIEPVIDSIPDVFGTLLDRAGVQIEARRITRPIAKWWIATRSPVIAGVKWREGMAYPAPKKVRGFWATLREFFRGRRYMRNEGKNLGFHAVALVGLRSKYGAYDVENSYGLGWGIKGKALLPYNDLDPKSELWGLELIQKPEVSE
jgi:hypothetical protein